MTDRHDDITRDILQLYELSLVIGRSLDVHTVCDDFLRVLVGRKNLSYAGVWIQANLVEQVGSAQEYQLVYALPSSRASAWRLPARHPSLRFVPDQFAWALGTADARFAELIAENDVIRGAYALFQLRDFGVLKLYSSRRTDFPRRELNQLRAVIDKFAIALRGALAYRHAIQETAERQLIQQTLEQRVQERTAQVQDLYDNAPCGYHSLDQEGRIILINDTELNWLGYRRAEVVGKMHFADLLTPTSRAMFLANFADFSAGGNLQQLEYEMQRKDTSTFSVLLSITRTHDTISQSPTSRITVVDISERKQAEAKILQLNNQLKAQATHLEATNQELSTFTYSVSHDLKAPLRGINGYCRLLLEDYANQLGEEGQRFLHHIRQATQQMGELIEDLLAYSRLERRSLAIKAIEVQTLVDQLLNEQAEAIAARAIRLTVRLPTGFTIQTDADALTFALRNLLDNAIKFTQHVATPCIEIGGRHNDSRATLWVRDNGIGFDLKFHERIFGIFQRLNRAEEYPGTGVGLAIVHKAMQRLGGRVWADSAPGQGATFYLELRDER